MVFLLSVDQREENNMSPHTTPNQYEFEMPVIDRWIELSYPIFFPRPNPFLYARYMQDFPNKQSHVIDQKCIVEKKRGEAE